MDYGIVHFAPWYRNKMRLQFADDLKPLIEGYKSLEIPVDWESKEAVTTQYLNRAFGNAYDFSQGQNA